MTIQYKSYGVLLADPAWKMDLWSAAGEHKAPQHHYPCMSTPDICALKDSLGLDWVCAPDCVLVMWTTFPMLARGDAHEVMRAWGFTPKTGGAWAKMSKHGKQAFGGGYIYRSACEPWLLGTRGEPQERTSSTRNLIIAERREHSRKPDLMHEMIEAQFAGPYLELFARTRRPGWDVWGNDVDKFPQPEAVPA